MKKVMFVMILALLLIPVALNAQVNQVNQDNIKNEINEYLTNKSYSLQELNTKLVDEYGINNIKFVKLENGKYIPVKAEEVKAMSNAPVSPQVVTVFAVIGAVFVALVVLRALLVP